VLRSTAPSETYTKLDAMATSLVEQLRLAFKQVLHIATAVTPPSPLTPCTIAE